MQQSTSLQSLFSANSLFKFGTVVHSDVDVSRNSPFSPFGPAGQVEVEMNLQHGLTVNSTIFSTWLPAHLPTDSTRPEALATELSPLAYQSNCCMLSALPIRLGSACIRRLLWNRLSCIIRIVNGLDCAVTFHSGRPTDLRTEPGLPSFAAHFKLSGASGSEIVTDHDDNAIML
jgi:hypothetical protein